MIMPGHVSRVKQGKLEPKEKREKKAIRDLRELRVPKETQAIPALKGIKATQVSESQMWMYSIISPQVPPLFLAGRGLRLTPAGRTASISGQKR